MSAGRAMVATFVQPWGRNAFVPLAQRRMRRSSIAGRSGPRQRHHRHQPWHHHGAIRPAIAAEGDAAPVESPARDWQELLGGRVDVTMSSLIEAASLTKEYPQLTTLFVDQPRNPIPMASPDPAGRSDLAGLPEQLDDPAPGKWRVRRVQQEMGHRHRLTGRATHMIRAEPGWVRSTGPDLLILVVVLGLLGPSRFMARRPCIISGNGIACRNFSGASWMVRGFPAPLLNGLGITLQIAALSTGLTLVIGLATALLRMSPSWAGQALATLDLEVVRTLPSSCKSTSSTSCWPQSSGLAASPWAC